MLLLTDLRVDSDGDRFLESVTHPAICNFLDAVAKPCLVDFQQGSPSEVASSSRYGCVKFESTPRFEFHAVTKPCLVAFQR